MVRIAVYGRISGHKDVMFKEKAALIQHYNAIIQQHDGWLYSGMYIDSGSSHEQLEDLLSCCRERDRSSLWLCKTYMKKGREACPSRCIREDRLLALLGTVDGTVDNITVWPDGRLTINTSTDSIERKWR